jgi:hypothetical protein
MLFDPSKGELERESDASAIDPIKVAVFHCVVITGFLLVHFVVAPLW